MADDARLAGIELRRERWKACCAVGDWDGADDGACYLAAYDIPWLIARVRELEAALQALSSGEPAADCGACEDGWSDSAEHTCQLGERR